MDTPESKSTPANNSKFKLINPSSSDSSAFQDSPVFNYISNLSPIEHVKAGPVAQGFPGLASPPLVFTSPRINSITSFFNRKLQSSGPNSEFSQDHEYSEKNEKDLNDTVKLNPESQSPVVPSDQKACHTEKLVLTSHCSPSVCFDVFLADPGECANPSNTIQSDVAHPSIDVSNGKDPSLVGSGLQRGKPSAQARSRISVKLVKNNARHLISSSECSGALSRSLTDDKSDLGHTGDSTSEASQFDRGTLRRCLFDESQRKNCAVGSGFRTATATAQILESANMSTEKSGNRQTINLSKPATSASLPPVSGNYPPVNLKPLGIGLHLNSVVYPRTTDSTVGSEQSSVLRVEGNNLISVRSNQSERKVKGTNVIAKVLASSEDISQHQTCLGSTTDITIGSDASEQSNDAVELKLDASTVQYHKRKFSSDLSENNESSVASPKKKRKKASSSIDDDATKRCNCKKTKCLKLYCDCFAAGFYCGESCACQGCFNRPENEDTVLETRQQIESRNPLAFAPKVMQPVADSPAIIKEIGNLSTPSSARHKRGCNCKKSMCLKKYCECYQANVGCSEGCRCEGCKNIYGIREDYSIAREILIKRTSIEMSEGSMTVSSSSASSRAHNSPNLIPVTPALQCSDQKKNTAKSRLPFRRFLQSSDSQQDTLTSEDNLASPNNSQNHRLLLEKNKCMEVGVLDADEEGFENTDDRFAPAGDESINAPCPAQSSITDATDSNLRDTSQPEFIEESGPPPPISSSLRWRSSPITPITQLAPSELKDFGTVSKHSDLFEDDTPEILKPSSTPVESVKMSSPNKKRISPPHNCINSSESLRSSRKFVLRAVPTFPSLTPYSKNGSNDSRGHT